MSIPIPYPLMLYLLLPIERGSSSYVVGVVSQFMQKPRTIHLDAAYRILR